MPKLTTATRDHRLQQMHALMDRERWEALLFTQGDFLDFASNFRNDVQTWERPVLAVVPRHGRPFALLNELSTNHWRFCAEAGELWIDTVHFYSEHPRTEDPLPLVTEWPATAAALLEAAGLGRARVGVDAISGPLALAAAALPGLQLHAAMAACRSLRLVKHAEEIAVVRELCALTDWVQERYREQLRPGRVLQELDCAIGALMAEEAGRRFPGEDFEPPRVHSISGPASCAPHGDGRMAGARAQPGHSVINILIPRLNGLVVENERTWFCGKPSARQAELYGAALAANEAAREAAVAGRPVSGIDAAALAVFERAGVAGLVRHRTGHGMGILGHEFPHDMPFCHRPLLAGEIYSAEPGLYEWGLGGFRIDDTLLIGSVPESLTQAARDLAGQIV